MRDALRCVHAVPLLLVLGPLARLQLVRCLPDGAAHFHDTRLPHTPCGEQHLDGKQHKGEPGTMPKP